MAEGTLIPVTHDLGSRDLLEAGVGIEPAYTALQFAYDKIHAVATRFDSLASLVCLLVATTKSRAAK